MRKIFINDDEQQIFLWTYSHSASCFTYCAQYLRRRYLNFFFCFFSLLFFGGKSTAKIKYGKKSLQIKSFNIITFQGAVCSKNLSSATFFFFSVPSFPNFPSIYTFFVHFRNDVMLLYVQISIKHRVFVLFFSFLSDNFRQSIHILALEIVCERMEPKVQKIKNFLFSFFLSFTTIVL